MNDILGLVDWVIKALEVFIVAFFLVKFRQHKWSLLFGGKRSLRSIEDHELHSCFIAALCVVVFHNIGGVLGGQLLVMEMEKLELRRVYYFIMIMNSFFCAAAIFLFHLIRKCTFSKTAKLCLYLAVVTTSLCFIQLVARGIYDFDGLSPFYKVAVNVTNIVVLCVVAIYPIKQIKKIKKKSAKEA
ncbi:hypothetical protein [Pseudoalteromonas obscura]|uniref:Uncharacterized protein n=1 Tax=Pseudoalteromonas obscura TaxID=3048491 RepID=A0ABT7EJM7_9GAMM|nr:hypothetical protein [Pseudoalteromonas sp. P94(2023)]MDK2595235.1 hypothetical protein [Pseudoalteromonas sp. P94(2023)]